MLTTRKPDRRLRNAVRAVLASNKCRWWTFDEIVMRSCMLDPMAVPHRVGQVLAWYAAQGQVAVSESGTYQYRYGVSRADRLADPEPSLDMSVCI